MIQFNKPQPFFLSLKGKLYDELCVLYQNPLSDTSRIYINTNQLFYPTTEKDILFSHYHYTENKMTIYVHNIKPCLSPTSKSIISQHTEIIEHAVQQEYPNVITIRIVDNS